MSFIAQCLETHRVQCCPQYERVDALQARRSGVNRYLIRTFGAKFYV